MSATTADDMPPAIDPQGCTSCVRLRRPCDFHTGIEVGWDYALALLAEAIDGGNEPTLEDLQGAGLVTDPEHDEASRLRDVVGGLDTWARDAVLAAARRHGLPGEGDTWEAWDRAVLSDAASDLATNPFTEASAAPIRDYLGLETP